MRSRRLWDFEIASWYWIFVDANLNKAECSCCFGCRRIGSLF
ncbi:hypothetical protein RchiOBHm_Chr4g0412591 [Rosa chinensis]|uniref:Uncharacterized protein n=1 Tax=Rosa chinensis TaxID=74649 RepID=A0A2P6QVY5_ROSCH|nr:hypothetical protein RchiOBHm_Chr4g0412591 [Rosa chinensis]